MTSPLRHRRQLRLTAVLLIALGLLVLAPLFRRAVPVDQAAHPPPAAPDAVAAAKATIPPATKSPASQPQPPQPRARSASAQNRIANPARKHFRLVSATPTETRFVFELGDIQTATVTRPYGDFTQVKASDAWFTQCPGAPALPVFQTDLLLPDGLEATLEIANAEFEDIPTLPVLPSAGPSWRRQPAPDCPPDPAIYQSGQPYPEVAAKLGKPYRLRKTTGAAVIVAPVQYFPQRHLLRVFRRLELTLRADQADVDDYPAADQEWNFQVLQTNRFLNASLLRNNPNNGIGVILVVRPDAWAGAADAFIAWKQSLGFNVEEVSFPADTGSSADALLAHIQEAYQQRDLTHVILCGDHNDVPPWRLSATPADPNRRPPTSDIRYCQLEGDDLVPDVFLSRVPATTSIQLGNILAKFIAYEAAPPADDSWRQHAIFLASDQKSPSSVLGKEQDYILMGRVRDALIDAEAYPAAGCTSLFAPTATAAALTNAFNLGAAVMLYLGHGTNTAFTTTGFNAIQAAGLTNDDKLPFVLSPVCDNGNFAYPNSDCLAEALLHASDGNGARHGAIAILAATSNTYWDPPIASVYQFRDDLIAAFSPSRLTQFGAYSQAAVMAGFDYATATTAWPTNPHAFLDNTAAYYSEQMHLLGDCAMTARLRPLQEITATVAFDEANTVLTVTATWEDGAPVPGAIVTLADQDGNLRHAATTNADGIVAWTRDLDCRSLALKIHDASAWTYTKTINIEPLELAIPSETVFTGAFVDLNLLPDNFAQNTLTDIFGLPPGMILDQDGHLRGIPTTPGAYALSFQARTQGDVLYQITAAISALSPPDQDGDGAISNLELLASLEECRDFAATESARNAIIAQWVDSGEQPSTRQGSEKPETIAAVETETNATPPAWRIVIAAPEPNAFAQLAETGVDIVTATANTITLHGDLDAPERLTLAGFVIQTMEAIELTRAELNSLYPSPQQINDAILALARDYGGLCRAGYVGASAEQREILSLRITTNDNPGAVPKLLIVGAIHGDERPAAVMTLRLAQYLAQTASAEGPAGDRVRNLLAKAEIHLLPTVNPDGVARGRRNNANNKDLNRNFPDGVKLPDLGAFAAADSLQLAGSEPETQALIRWCAAHRFSASLNLHTGALLVCYPYGNNADYEQIYTPTPDDSLMVRLANAYAQANVLMRTADWPLNGIINSAQWYPVTGEFADWQYRFLGIHALTVELYCYSYDEGGVNNGKESSNPSHLDALWNANRAALLNWLEAAATGVSLTIIDQATGQPTPGAIVEVVEGQAMAASPDGLCHRPLIPGTHLVTVTAPGCEPVGPLAVDVVDSQTAIMPVTLTRTSSVRARPMPQRGRFLPKHPNTLSWDITATETPPAAAIVTLTLPADWPAPTADNTSADAIRQEAADAVALLVLASPDGPLPASLQVTLTPPAAATADHVFETTIAWRQSEQPSLRQHWLTAEPRSVDLNLHNGWNLAGPPIALDPDQALLPPLDAWRWHDNTWRRTAISALPPASGAWIYADAQQDILLHGWMTQEDLPALNQGWNLVVIPWPMTVANPELALFAFDQNKTLRRTNATNSAEPIWIMKK